jgi:hypothetical protein
MRIIKEFFEFVLSLLKNSKQGKKLPSRRFNCLTCGAKCRSSIQDRGKRKYCRPCEKEISAWKNYNNRKNPY